MGKEIKKSKYSGGPEKGGGGGGRGDTSWVNFCWVCAAGHFLISSSSIVQYLIFP